MTSGSPPFPNALQVKSWNPNSSNHCHVSLLFSIPACVLDLNQTHNISKLQGLCKLFLLTNAKYKIRKCGGFSKVDCVGRPLRNIKKQLDALLVEGRVSNLTRIQQNNQEKTCVWSLLVVFVDYIIYIYIYIVKSLHLVFGNVEYIAKSLHFEQSNDIKWYQMNVRNDACLFRSRDCNFPCSFFGSGDHARPSMASQALPSHQ